MRQPVWIFVFFHLSLQLFTYNSVAIYVEPWSACDASGYAI